MSEESCSVDESEVAKLVGIVRSAAALRLDMIPYSNDCRSESSLPPVYAVDTNVVKLFLNPSEAAHRTNQGGAGYGVVFQHDERDTSIALGAALSRFIFYRLTGSRRGLLLLPGHDVETRGMYDAIFNDEGHEWSAAKSEHAALRARLQELALITKKEEQTNWLEKNASRLFNYLFGDSSAVAQFDRFNRLLADGRVRSLLTVADEQTFFDSELGEDESLRAVFSIPNELHHMLEESSYLVTWEKWLVEAKPRHPMHRIRADSQALARLEVINRHLRERKRGRRLLLITGDEHLFTIGRRYTPFTNGQEKGANFASLYLRHPKAFLAVPEVLTAHDDGTQDREAQTPELVEGWLDALLARYSGYHDVEERALYGLITNEAGSDERLRSRALEALRRDKDAAVTILHEWRKYTNALRKAHSATSALAREEIARAFGVSAEAEAVLRSLDELLARKKEQNWSRFFQALTRAGYDLLAEDGVRTRNPPPITFGSFRRTGEFIHQVIARQGGKVTADVFERRIRDVQMDDGDTGYVLALAYATLFACTNRWLVAAQLAQHAIDLADGIRAKNDSEPPLGSGKRVHERISGREALYFKAVAQRVRARSQEEFDVAERLIERAEEALAQDLKRADPPNISGIRFEVERLGLRVSRHINRLFRERIDLDGPAILELLRALLEMSIRCEQLEKEGWIRSYLKRELLTKTFMIAAILEKNSLLDEPTFQLCRAHLEDLCRATADSPPHEGFPLCRIERAIADYALARFGSTETVAASRRVIRNNINSLKLELDAQPEHVLVAPNDRERLLLLHALTDSALNKV